jgi:hypothetical protein
MAQAGKRLPDFDVWWDYDHPDATEVRFREVLPLAEQAGGRGCDAWARTGEMSVVCFTRAGRLPALQRGGLVGFEVGEEAIYEAFEQVWAKDGEDDEDGGGDAQDGAD